MKWFDKNNQLLFEQLQLLQIPEEFYWTLLINCRYDIGSVLNDLFKNLYIAVNFKLNDSSIPKNEIKVVSASAS